MKKLKDFNYDKMVDRWGTFDEEGDKYESGLATTELAERAQEMAQMILSKLNIGLCLYDLGDIFWQDKLWYIEDDYELFDRVQGIVAELLEDIGGSAKERKQFIKEIFSYKFNNGGLL